MIIFWFLYAVMFLAGAFACAYSGWLKNQSEQDSMALLGVLFIVISILLLFARAVYQPLFKKED